MGMVLGLWVWDGVTPWFVKVKVIIIGWWVLDSGTLLWWWVEKRGKCILW